MDEIHKWYIKAKKKSSLVKRGGILLFELRFQDKKLSISCEALTWLWTMVLWPKHWRCTHKRIAGTGRGGWMWILSLWTLKDKGAFTPLPYDCKGFENGACRLMACLSRYKCLPCKPDPLSSVHKSQMWWRSFLSPQNPHRKADVLLCCLHGGKLGLEIWMKSTGQLAWCKWRQHICFSAAQTRIIT